MKLADIHLHALTDTDDGVKTEAEMFRMVDLMCREGCRALCLTPHFHPGYFGDNRKKADDAFAVLKEYASEAWPELQLFRGNELRYSDDCVSWLEDGACRTLNGSRYVLVDFSAAEERRTILRGLDRLLNAGYTPVLAHAERYEKLHPDMREIQNLSDRGVVIQVDGGSLFGAFGLRARLRSRKLVERHLADVVASDAHDLIRRPPMMAKSLEFIQKRQGEMYAKQLCATNAMRILDDIAIKKG